MFLAWGALDLPEGELEQLTPATLPDADAVRRDGRRARDRGWAVTEDELEIGLTGIAVPVFGLRGDVVAALGISGPTAGWPSGSTSSDATCSTSPPRCPRCCAVPPHRPAHRAARTKEVVA